MASATKRVLVLNHFAAPRAQAGGTRHVELFSRLTGWEYSIIAARLNHQTGLRQDREEGFVPVPVLAYRSNGVRRILNWLSYALSALVYGLCSRRVHVVYASSPHLLAALAGYVVASVRRVPLILEIRDLWPQILVDMGHLSEKSAIYRSLSALESFLYSRADHIVVMAEGSRTALLKRGVPADSISYIPNGADPEDFRPSASRTELRIRYGFERFTAVYAGAHGPANGLDLLLDAAEQLNSMPIDIVLVGGGVEKPHLMEAASARRLSNVHFLEPIPKHEVPDILHAADVGLHVLADVELFRSSISPNKVFDYMAAGRPVLTNCPGLVSELVESAECGLAVEPSGLAWGLKQLSQDGTGKMGQSGVEWITKHQSRTAMAQRLLSILISPRDGSVA